MTIEKMNCAESEDKKKSSSAIERVLEAFKTGNIPAAVAFSTYPVPPNIPARRWSIRNRIIIALFGGFDCRGFRQWEAAGRKVKKGAKAVYIQGPCIKGGRKITVEPKDETEEKREELKITRTIGGELVGFTWIPVFKAEDTEGAPLSYDIPQPRTDWPLIEVARAWGIEVRADFFHGRALGQFGGRVDGEGGCIVMSSDDASVWLHELAHAAHYRIDKEASKAPTWIKEVVADLSAAALLVLLGKDPLFGNTYEYIKRYATQGNMDVIRACLHVIDLCGQVVGAIVEEADKIGTCEIAAVA